MRFCTARCAMRCAGDGSSATPPTWPIRRRSRDRRAQSWTARSSRASLNHGDDDRLFALWRLAATSGMRRGELAGVTWRALDLDGGAPLRRPAAIEDAGRPSFGPPKSARSRRTIALDPETVDALRAAPRSALSSATLPARPTSTSTSCLPTQLGGPTDPQRLTERFDSTARPRASRRDPAHAAPHGGHARAHVRRSRAHRRGTAGRRPEDRLSTYAHLLPQSDELAAERVAELLA